MLFFFFSGDLRLFRHTTLRHVTLLRDLADRDILIFGSHGNDPIS